jgi:hypothetical protein
MSRDGYDGVTDRVNRPVTTSPDIGSRACSHAALGAFLLGTRKRSRYHGPPDSSHHRKHPCRC